MSFKFIAGEGTGFTALDEPVLSQLDLTGIFVGQKKRKSFRLGNTGAASTDFAISTSGLNSSINDDVQYSIDGGSIFATTATVSGIQPNEISQDIFVEYTPQEGDVLGEGSFLIRVDEE